MFPDRPPFVTFKALRRYSSNRIAYLDQLESGELEALLLKTLDDLADEATLDAVGLDHNVGTLASHT